MKAQTLAYKKMLVPLVVVLVLALPLALGVAHADQSVTIPICSNQEFSNTGWTTKSFTVDVSKLSNAKQVMIHVSGKAVDDSYVRYLVVIIDNQVVNLQTLDRKWDGSISGFTDVVSGQFDLKYDVTNLVKGKNSVTVKIGITTYYKWTISAEFLGVQGDNINIPTPGNTTPSGGMEVPVPTAAAIAGLAFIGLGLYFKEH